MGFRSAAGISFIAAVLMTVGVAATAGAQGVDPLEASVRELQRAVTPQRDGSHHDRLRGLRALKDPSLVPFFTRGAATSSAAVRVQSILALAELSEKQSIDPWNVRKLDSGRTRLDAITLAILQDLISNDAMHEILAWDDAEEEVRIVLLSELVNRGERIEPDWISPLVESERPEISRPAACLMMHATGSRAAFEPVKSAIGSLEPEARVQAQGELITMIGLYRLGGMLWWVEEVLGPDDVDPRLVLPGVIAALQTDVDAGLRLLNQAVERDPSDSNRVRLAVALLTLAGERSVPAAAFEVVRSDDLPLAAAIADVGGALDGGGGEPAAAFNALIDLGHWGSSAAAIVATEQLPEEARIEIYRHIIGRLESTAPRPQDREALAIHAATLLAETDLDAAAELLRGIDDDSRTQEAVLIGLLAADVEGAGEVVSDLRRLGMGRADSLALLLMAKDAAELGEADRATLGSIAAGGARLSPAHQSQAAWLFMKHSGKVEFAISRLFSGGS